ncbi:MAG: hypothetical protein R3320_07295 [Nitriliruptorales bacterium]|nr:hypothetical protein [Nitriliruptorales bacterium]
MERASDDWKRVARRHAPFLVVLGLGLVLRILATIAYQPALLYQDSYGYLILSESLDPTTLWPLGYPLFLKGFLAIASLPLVPVFHHLLGLAMGVFLYILLLRWGAPRWVAVLAVVPVLLDAYQLHSETRVMTETVFQTLVVAGLGLLTWKRRIGWVALIAAGLLLGMTVPVRMVGQAVLVVTLIGVGLGLTWWRPALVKLAALGLAMAIPVAAYATYYHSQTDEWGLTPDWVAERTLYTRAARFMDCDQLDVRAAYRPLCPTEEQQANMRTDDFNWGFESPLNQWEPPEGVDKNQVAGDLARRAIREQPLEFAYWVARDVMKSFAPRRETFRFDMPVERWRFQTEWPKNRSDWEPILANHWEGEPHVEVPIARALRTYQLSVGYVPPTLFGIAGLLGLAGGIAALRRGDRRFAAVILLWTGVGFVLIGLPAIYQFSQRYQIPTFVLLPVAGALGATALFWRPDDHRLTERPDVLLTSDKGSTDAPH